MAFVVALGGCATPSATSQYKNALKTYSDTSWPESGLTVSLPQYWRTSAEIAGKYDRTQEKEFFEMMSLEATKKEVGAPSQYDQLEARFRGGDQSVWGTAVPYFINLTAENNCSSFGYAKGTGDYNKCVFDLRMRLTDRRVQSDIAVMQMMMANRPAPPRLPTQTTCTTNGNQTNCATR